MPRRRKASPVESSVAISLAAILVLAGMAIGLLAFLRGPYYEAALADRAAAAPEGPVRPPAGGGGADPLPLEIPGIGWPRSQVERYTPQTLFEKIDGRDRAYLDFDVAGLVFASYRNPAAEPQLVDLYVYDMRRPLHAIGIFAAERAGTEPLIPIGDLGYQDESSVFFRKGRHYVQAIGSLPDPVVAEAARALAAAAASLLPAEPAVPYDALPAEGRIAGSEGFALHNAFGIEGLDRVFLARYGDPARATTAFAAECGSPERAQAILATYIERFGAGAQLAELDAGGARLILREGSAAGAFASGSTVAGIQGAPDEAAARRLLEALAASVRSGIPKEGS